MASKRGVVSACRRHGYHVADVHIVLLVHVHLHEHAPAFANAREAQSLDHELLDHQLHVLLDGHAPAHADARKARLDRHAGENLGVGVGLAHVGG